MDRIQGLEENLNKTLAKKDQLAKDVAQCSTRLESAQKLIGGLGGERVRWEDSVKQFNVDVENVLGDVLISSASVAYLAHLRPRIAKSLCSCGTQSLMLWECQDARIGVVQTLGNPVVIQAWQIAGLPFRCPLYTKCNHHEYRTSLASPYRSADPSE